MNRKIYGFVVSPPNTREEEYLNFVNSKFEKGNKREPSILEMLLPNDWKSRGYGLNRDKSFNSIPYEFPEHSKGLSIEEILQITRTLFELGATSWSFRSTEED